MAIKTSAGFEHRGKEPHFADQQFKTKAEMKAYPEYDISEGLISYCLEDKNNYQWKSSNPVSATTGRWAVFSSGGGGGSLPSGGTTGQALVKKSNADQDVDWDDILAGVDYVFHTETEEIEVFGGEAPSVNPSDLISKDQDNNLTLGSDNKLFAGGGGGTTDYTDLENKPSINGVELIGDKTNADLDIFSKVDYSYDDPSATLNLLANEGAGKELTEEHKTGLTFLGKPIYEIAYQINLIATSSTASIEIKDISNLNIDKLLSIDGTFEYTNGETIPLPYPEGGNHIDFHTKINNTKIMIYNTVSWSVGMPAVITLRYTKKG